MASRGKEIKNIGSAHLYQYVSVGGTHCFNKNMLAYEEYRINLLSDRNPLGLKTDDITTVGQTYPF